ncbi:MAG: hypothetical protein CM1200mP29_14190 [Verrucomicrobiota bacterium]|nr:MAG: hypothetical protein CM1200mP29_14190 [Verrucomicrobiota bacterium]
MDDPLQVRHAHPEQLEAQGMIRPKNRMQLDSATTSCSAPATNCTIKPRDWWTTCPRRSKPQGRLASWLQEPFTGAPTRGVDARSYTHLRAIHLITRMVERRLALRPKKSIVCLRFAPCLAAAKKRSRSIALKSSRRTGADLIAYFQGSTATTHACISVCTTARP